MKNTSIEAAFCDLLSIIKKLRGPDGCPWDKEQSSESLCKYLLEESAELIDAIHSHRPDSVLDELGDVLLQVVFHAQIAEEQNLFSIYEVIGNLNEKLVRRHPHVFGEKKLMTSEQVIRNWDHIKTKEKNRSVDVGDKMKNLPGVLPPLLKAEKIQKIAEKCGFDWKDSSGPIGKIREELEELSSALLAAKQNRENVEGEMGDLLFSVVNLARHLKIDASNALEKTNRKFVDRFRKMENMLSGEGKTLENMSLEDLDAYWDKVKRLEASE